MTYRVVWEIDIDAELPEEAVWIARRYQLDPESIATVFTVYPLAAIQEIDLLEERLESTTEDSK